MYHLVEFTHEEHNRESINDGPWRHWIDKITTNLLVEANTFINACIKIQESGKYGQPENFRNLTLE